MELNLKEERRKGGKRGIKTTMKRNWEKDTLSGRKGRRGKRKTQAGGYVREKVGGRSVEEVSPYHLTSDKPSVQVSQLTSDTAPVQVSSGAYRPGWETVCYGSNSPSPLSCQRLVVASLH